jgi:uncharacterized protein DUF6941
MRATLLLADYARVADGKLDVLGGGFSMINARGAFGFFVAALIQIPWDQTNMQHHLRLDLLTADGEPVGLPDGGVVRVEADFEAGRPAGVRAGTPIDMPFVAPFGPLELEPGRYEVKLTIDGDSKEDWFVAFTLATPPVA